MTSSAELLVIGGSAGSLDAILEFLPKLSDIKIAVIIVLHRKGGDGYALSELLASKSKFPVKEAEEKENILNGIIYIAPSDYHLFIENDRTFSLDFSEKVNYSRPSIDVTFHMAAEVYGNKVMGLLLSGANADGTEGLKSIKQAGGLTIVQNPASAGVSFMPQHALSNSPVDYILEASQMADFLNNLGGKR